MYFDFGYEIEYSESIRPYKNKKTGEIEESSMLTDFYLVRDFNDSELRLLIDGLLFSTHLPYSQCKELVGKLEKQSSKYFHNRVKHIDVTAMVKVNNRAALQFAKNYAPHVLVIEPKELREQVIAELKRGIQGYESE